MVFNDLPRQHRDLILLTRSLADGILEVSVKDSTAQLATVRYPDMFQRQEINIHDLSKKEVSLLDTIRIVRFGRVVVKVEDGSPIRVLGDTYAQFLLGKVDWEGWTIPEFDKPQAVV